MRLFDKAIRLIQEQGPLSHGITVTRACFLRKKLISIVAATRPQMIFVMKIFRETLQESMMLLDNGACQFEAFGRLSDGIVWTLTCFVHNCSFCFECWYLKMGVAVKSLRSNFIKFPLLLKSSLFVNLFQINPHFVSKVPVWNTNRAKQN